MEYFNKKCFTKKHILYIINHVIEMIEQDVDKESMLNQLYKFKSRIEKKEGLAE